MQWLIFSLKVQGQEKRQCQKRVQLSPIYDISKTILNQNSLATKAGKKKAIGFGRRKEKQVQWDPFVLETNRIDDLVTNSNSSS